MAFMRGKYYTWENGEEIYFWDSPMPLKIFDALVVMRMAELITIDKKCLKPAIKEALKNQGNFGCDALCKLQGKMTGFNMVKIMIKVLKKHKKEVRRNGKICQGKRCKA